MNAQIGACSSLSFKSAAASADQTQPNQIAASAETALPSAAERSLAQAKDNSPAVDSQICWIEVKQYPYQPDHQVELLHLQAEADALLLQLQACKQRRAARASDRR
jgi:hypothetical protein